VEAEDALARTRTQIAADHDPALSVREGSAATLLFDEAIARRATLMALGTRVHSLAEGLVLGSVATAMLRDAPCSLLIVHRSAGRREDPGRREVLVGFDGSAGARRALAAARDLARRLQLPLRAIVACGDGNSPPPWVAAQLQDELAVSEDERGAVDALVSASASARMLVLGSRPLRHVPGTASVSEPVGHRAACPVLIVR
jgi:nucleotide-binding universal stress UspA family protein